MSNSWNFTTKNIKEKRYKSVTGSTVTDYFHRKKSFETTSVVVTQEKDPLSVTTVQKLLLLPSILRITDCFIRVGIHFKGFTRSNSLYTFYFCSCLTDERPFECDWEGCRLKFRRRHHLVAHKRVHTKERPFACSFPGCDMKFTKSHHVKRHYETHFKYKGLSSVAGSLDNPSSSTSTQSSHLPSSLLTSSSSPSPVQYSLVVPPVRDNLGLPGYVLTYPS